MTLRITLTDDADNDGFTAVNAHYQNDGGAPIALTFWWNRSMRVVDAAGIIVSPKDGPVLPCGVGEEWQVLAPGETFRRGEPLACTQPAGRSERIGWSYEHVAAGRYTVTLLYQAPPPHGFTQSRAHPQAFAGVVESNALAIDVAPKPPKKRGIIARLLG